MKNIFFEFYRKFLSVCKQDNCGQTIKQQCKGNAWIRRRNSWSQSDIKDCDCAELNKIQTILSRHLDRSVIRSIAPTKTILHLFGIWCRHRFITCLSDERINSISPNDASWCYFSFHSSSYGISYSAIVYCRKLR